MRKALKALDGWKLMIGVTILFAVGVFDATTGSNATTIVIAALSALGWAPGGEWTGEAIAKAVGGAVVLFGFGHRLYKAQAQAQVGVPVASLLTEEGALIKHAADLSAGKPEAIATEVRVAGIVG